MDVVERADKNLMGVRGRRRRVSAQADQTVNGQK
jgi:hypothetical protein